MKFSVAPEALKRLRRDIALRGGLISAGASLLALLLLSAIVWLFLLHRLEARVENALEARHAVAIANLASLTNEDRAVVQKFRKSLPIRDEGVFAWIDREGKTLSSNVSGLDCRFGFYDGWIDVSQQGQSEALPLLTKDQIDPSIHDRFRFLAKDRDDGRCLVFGRSMYEVDELHEGVEGLFLWLVPLCLLPALLVGLRQSWKLRQRLRQMGGVVSDLSGGNLNARMQVNGDDDLDRLAISTNRSFDRLQESVNTLQQLTSVMAHDLRAPLNRVAIPLDEAIRANHGGQPAVESLEEVQSGLEDVRSVFDALLRITQIESGRRRSNFTSINLFEIAERLYEIYQPVVEDADRTLEFEVAGEGTDLVHGDSELITQAIVNLIENATRYAPEGAVIRIGVLRDPKYPALTVKDNGPGLPEAERTLVLRRLYRYEGSTNGKSGHGLGLSLVKAIVDLHQAEITLEDASPGLMVRLQFEATKN